MRQSPKAKKPRKVIRKLLKANSYRRPPKRLSKNNPLETVWDDFKTDISAGVQNRRIPLETGVRSPYDKPESYLKRAVYKFVLECLARGDGRLLELAIEQDRSPTRPQGISFNENPFHWVFFGLRDPSADNLTRYNVARFGRQLLYARRHLIPPELLIGFIYQTGKPEEISRKAAQLDTYEEWFSPHSRAKTPTD